MPLFPAVIELSNPNDRVRFNGEAASDLFGISVASAGDVNGDGFDDVIIGAPNADGTASNTGSVYVKFGDASGVGSIDYEVSGASASQSIGQLVASAGDINGDGFDDVIFSAPFSPIGVRSGISFLLFGSETGLDADNGFTINGELANDESGYSVASAGDFNGDGFDDLLISAWRADPNGAYNAGASYVVFGADAAFPSELNLADLDGTNGFQINGEVGGDGSGRSAASAGDVNGDGFDDLIIGAWQADPNGSSSGSSYVVFGTDTASAANLNLSTLDGTNGFQIDGEARRDYSGFSAASAGDVNGDGFDDLIIGAKSADPNGLNSSGASYVVFGQASGFTTNLNLSTLNGANGFRINGETNYDGSGWSVASAGDVNGDGFDDVIVGANNADPNGDSNAGASYVVFGKGSAFAANVNLSALDGTNGFKINGEAPYDYSGWSVASAGDINGDGFGDLIVGAPFVDDGATMDAGAAYVIFGRESTDPLTLTGTAAGNIIRGGSAGDTIDGLGGNDRLFGRGGDDTLIGGEGLDRLDGGAGVDIMDGGDGNDTYIVDDAGDTIIDSAGTDRVFTSVDYTLANGVGIERLYAISADGLSLTGNRSANLIVGAEGDDTLAGGLGLDTLISGAGADIFLFDTKGRANNVDTITDFSVADDTIHLDNAAFTKLRFDGALDEKFFAIGAPRDETHRVLYDDTTGALSYDSDGSGAKAAVQFAQLGTGLALTAADFLIV